VNINSQPQNKSSDNFPAGRITNVFLNFTILLLSVVIIFLTYSIITKVDYFSSNSNDKENVGVNKKPVQLEVLNGCGVNGVAEKFTDYLRAGNFDVVNIGNYRSFDIGHSLLIDRTGNMSNAFKIASTLGIEKNNIIQQVNKEYFLDVTLVIGKDYKRLKNN
jgi:hypothetical protein